MPEIVILSQEPQSRMDRARIAFGQQLPPVLEPTPFEEELTRYTLQQIGNGCARNRSLRRRLIWNDLTCSSEGRATT